MDLFVMNIQRKWCNKSGENNYFLELLNRVIVAVFGEIGIRGHEFLFWYWFRSNRNYRIVCVISCWVECLGVLCIFVFSSFSIIWCSIFWLLIWNHWNCDVDRLFWYETSPEYKWQFCIFVVFYVQFDVINSDIIECEVDEMRTNVTYWGWLRIYRGICTHCW